VSPARETGRRNYRSTAARYRSYRSYRARTARLIIPRPFLYYHPYTNLVPLDPAGGRGAGEAAPTRVSAEDGVV